MLDELAKIEGYGRESNESKNTITNLVGFLTMQQELFILLLDRRYKHGSFTLVNSHPELLSSIVREFRLFLRKDTDSLLSYSDPLSSRIITMKNCFYHHFYSQLVQECKRNVFQAPEGNTEDTYILNIMSDLVTILDRIESGKLFTKKQAKEVKADLAE